MSFFFYPTQISVSEDDGACGGFKSCLYVPLDGFCTLSKHTTESKLYSLPLNPSLEMNYICSNWKLFFFLFHLPFFFSRYSSEGQCPPSVSLHLFLLGRFYYHYYYFSLNSTLPLFSSHISCVCDFPQDSADGGALARSHLHRRRVFQRGANRLRQRPEVSKDGAAHSKDTTGRRSASLRGSRIMAALYIDGVYYSN